MLQVRRCRYFPCAFVAFSAFLFIYIYIKIELVFDYACIRVIIQKAGIDQMKTDIEIAPSPIHINSYPPLWYPSIYLGAASVKFVKLG